MTPPDLDTYFYRIIDRYLLDSLEPWQVAEIKRMVNKAYKKGKKLT